MLFRYPGSKGKVAKVIVPMLADCLRRHPNHEYREPFFGAGAIGFELLKTGLVKDYKFNDRDPAMCSVWWFVAFEPDSLKQKLLDFTPTVDSFYEFKNSLLNVSEMSDARDQDYLEVAFRKVAIHQMSYSGLGTKAGGPIGGLKQGSAYGIGCRYNALGLGMKIDKLHALIRTYPIQAWFVTSFDFEVMVRDYFSNVIYLDPPYYAKGPELYQFSFTEDDHKRLAASLRATNAPWLLSYDDHPAIVELYEGWSDIGYIDLKYSINSKTDNVKRELLIQSKNFKD